MTPTLTGTLVLGIPLLLLGLVFLRRWRPVLWMFVGALAIGLGYLATTGALADIGNRTLALVGKAAPAGGPKAAAPAK